MNLNPLQLQPAVKAADLPFDKLAGNSNVSDSDKVKQACRQFEAVLLRQILGEAAKTTLGPTGQGKSATTDIYNDMINNQFADSISRSGAFGLAKSLQTQLVHQVLSPTDAGSSDKTAVTTTTKS